jgi:hypothetical protein
MNRLTVPAKTNHNPPSFCFAEHNHCAEERSRCSRALDNKIKYHHWQSGQTAAFLLPQHLICRHSDFGLAVDKARTSLACSVMHPFCDPVMVPSAYIWGVVPRSSIPSLSATMLPSQNA